jgi:hypothetical protein
MLDPRCAKTRTLKQEPKRPAERIEIDEPKNPALRTESLVLDFVCAITLIELPNLDAARRLKVEPNCAKLSVEIADPNRVNERIESADPNDDIAAMENCPCMLQRVATDIEEPIFI